MSRFEQRAKKRLQQPDVLKGYQEVDAELTLLARLDEARQQLGISQETLAGSLRRSQSAVSQFFSGNSGVTIERLLEYLKAMRLQARVEFVQVPSGAPALIVNRPDLTKEKAKRVRA